MIEVLTTMSTWEEGFCRGWLLSGWGFVQLCQHEKRGFVVVGFCLVEVLSVICIYQSYCVVCTLWSKVAVMSNYMVRILTCTLYINHKDECRTIKTPVNPYIYVHMSAHLFYFNIIAVRMFHSKYTCIHQCGCL